MKILLSLTLLVALALPLAAAPADYNLRSFGAVQVTAEPTAAPGVIVRHFRFAEGKGLSFASLLLSDLFSRDVVTATPTQLAGTSVTVYDAPGEGALALLGNARDMYVACAPSSAALTPALTALLAGPARGMTGAFRPDAHPIYLENFGKYSVAKMYTAFASALGKFPRPSNKTDLQFYREMGLKINERSINWSDEYVAGAPSWGLRDWVLDLCRQNGSPLEITSCFGLSMPWYVMENRAELTNRTGDVAGAWSGVYSSSPGYSPRAEDPMRRYVKQLIGRYGDNPLVACWDLGAGDVSNDSAFCPQVDYSEASQAYFRQYLRQVKGYTLAQLNARWGRNFTDWEQVRIPGFLEFWGAEGRLSERCLWRVTRAVPADWEKQRTAWTQPGFADESWVQYDLPNAEHMLRVSGGGCYRSRVTLDEVKGPIYFYYLSSEPDGSKSELYVNGQAVGAFNGTALDQTWPWSPWAVDVTRYLQPGVNNLCVYHPGNGVGGAMYLSRSRPRRYPYWGEALNGRWVDWKDYQEHCISGRMEAVTRAIRKYDPVRPMSIANWGHEELSASAELADKYGVYFRETGGTTGCYSPWNDNYGYTSDTYGGSESGRWFEVNGQIPRSYYFNYFGWFMLDAEEANMTFEDYGDEWPAAENRKNFMRELQDRYFRFYGESTKAAPNLGIYISEKINFYQSTFWKSSVWLGDLNRELIQWGIDCGGVSDYHVETGAKLDRYPVLWDPGNEILDEAQINGLIRYVQNGGTYICQSFTGRNSPTRPDSWPITRLTGYAPAGHKSANELFQFEPEQTIFPGFAGHWMVNQASFVDYTGEELIHNYGWELKPVAPGTQTVAHWKGGGVAVGMRTLGKGRVIVLGSPFWRSCVDTGRFYIPGRTEREVLLSLFAGVGVKREVVCDQKDIWAKHNWTRNGRDNWLVVYNFSDRPQTVKELRVVAATKPARLVEKRSGREVPFTWADGWATVRDLPLEANETLILAWTRQPLADAVGFWWDYHTRHWAMTPAMVACRQDPEPSPTPYTLNLADNWSFRQAEELPAGWEQGATPAADWKAVPRLALWEQYPDAARTGHGYYLKRFATPAGWQGREISLRVQAYPMTWYDTGRVYLNGTLVQDWTGTPVDAEVTALLQATGDNVLAFEVKSGRGAEVMGGGGVIGTVALYARARPEATMEVSEGWRVNQGGDQWLPATPGAMCAGLFLDNAQVMVPANWQGRRVQLEFSWPAQGASWQPYNVVINGEVVNTRQQVGRRMLLDITPWVHWGAANHLEIWSNGGTSGTPTKGAFGGVRLLSVKEMPL
ncbi:MAG TPA: hypothetical protein VGM19_08270 [Armatimonadota bacterium]